MPNLDAPVIPALDIAEVTKIYTQWQRGGRLRDIAGNLFHPRKREITALGGLSLTVAPGEFLAYAGANGAGKSTTIKILSGILRPTSGTVRVLGMDPARDRIALMRRIGVLFGQRSELWWDHPVLTSFEWKKQVWDIPGAVYRENLALVTELLDLEGFLHTFSRELSLGQRMRADLAMLLLHSPEVLFLDEPTLGLDVLAKRDMIAFLRRVNEERGVTIVVTSHDMDDLEEMARRIVLLDHGRLAFDGTFDDLRRARGNRGRVRVTLSGPPDSLPALCGLTPVSVTDGSPGGNTGGSAVREFSYDRAQVTMRDVLRELSALEGVEDVELSSAPIEEVVAGLYLSWKNAGK